MIDENGLGLTLNPVILLSAISIKSPIILVCDFGLNRPYSSLNVVIACLHFLDVSISAPCLWAAFIAYNKKQIKILNEKGWTSVVAEFMQNQNRTGIGKTLCGHQIVGPVGPVGHLHLWSDSEGLTKCRAKCPISEKPPLQH